MKTKIIALLATGLLLMSLVGPAFAAQMPKEYVCHDGETIHISGNAMAAHLAHGDTIIDAANLCP